MLEPIQRIPEKIQPEGNLSADPCVFISQNQNQKLILAIYIDDGLIVAQNRSLIDKFLSDLKKEFNDKNLFLGMHIKREADGSIFLHEETYAKRVLGRFRMEETNPVSIPADSRQELCSLVQTRD